jgi:spermidine dehydrogenase
MRTPTGRTDPVGPAVAVAVIELIGPVRQVLCIGLSAYTVSWDLFRCPYERAAARCILHCLLVLRALDGSTRKGSCATSRLAGAILNKNDRTLGMNRDISRRDFINGVAMAAGALALPMSALATEAEYSQGAQNPYPPARLGMRGSHPGSFEVGHALRDSKHADLSGAERTGETYDLIVVGGGLSGLGAAHYFLKNVGRDAKVLVLDNHDDFGGHAKRNELSYQGKLLAINGGTQEIESPSRYNKWATQLLKDIGADLDAYRKGNEANEKLYGSLGLRGGHFFDKETFGVDRLVVAPPIRGGGEGLQSLFSAEYVRNMPISERAKRDLLRLEDPNQPDYMPGLTSAQKKERLAHISYRDYLLKVAKVDEQAYWFYMASGRSVFCVGADALPALFAWQMGEGLGGFAGLKLDPSPQGLLANLPGGQHGRQIESEESVVHFPDGNATLARLLVRWLIPDAIPGSTQDDVGTARVNYELLDRPTSTARIRLNSTVLNVRHDGDPKSARETIVSYNTAGKIFEVRGRACVMACWNMFIPYLIPELPSVQKEALAYNVKGPIVFSNVFLRNWKAFEKLGIKNVDCPTMYHDTVALAEPADLGGVHHARNPNDPDARVSRSAAQGTASDWARGSSGHFVRDVRAQHSQSTDAYPRAGRFRSCARHRRNCRQSLATRILLYL